MHIFHVNNTQRFYSQKSINTEKDEEKTIKKSSVYTRGGDKGETYLFNMNRMSKESLIFQALGNVDETNSAIGIARQYILQELKNHKNFHIINNQLEIIQSRLLDIGSNLATPKTDPKTTAKQLERVVFDNDYVIELEHWIDEIDNELPALKNFILPGGGLISTHLHLARSIVRRAERSIVPIINNKDADENVLVYINRLSDYLFVAARYTTIGEEVVYKKGK